MKWAYVGVLAVVGIAGWKVYDWNKENAEMQEIKQISDATGGVQGGQEWQDLAKRMQEQRMQADRQMMQFQQEQDRSMRVQQMREQNMHLQLMRLHQMGDFAGMHKLQEDYRQRQEQNTQFQQIPEEFSEQPEQQMALLRESCKKMENIRRNLAALDLKKAKPVEALENMKSDLLKAKNGCETMPKDYIRGSHEFETGMIRFSRHLLDLKQYVEGEFK